MASAEYNRKYYLANKERLKAASKAYAVSNKEVLSAKKKKLYWENKELFRARNKATRKKYREKYNQKSKQWHIDNKEKVIAYRIKNKARDKLKKAEWHQKNKKRQNAKARQWALENPDKNRARVYKRKTRLMKACPHWADLEAIKVVYSLAKNLEIETGIKYHVDHIVPLVHKNVCGLHIAINLRAIPAIENNIKKNRLLEEIINDYPFRYN